MAATSFPDRGPTVRGVTTATLVVASVFVAARLVSRAAIVRNVTLDDWFIVLAWFLAFGLSFAIDFGTAKGLGRYDINIPSEWLYSLRRSEYAFSVLYNPALMATKTAILIFYLRLSRNTNRLLRIASYITLAVVNIEGVVLTFLSVFQCRPVGAIFDLSSNTAQCIPLVTLYLGSAPVNLITDLAILVLPIPVLTGMNLPQKQKSILVATFALGAFVAVVDVVRIYYLQQASIDRSGKTLADTASRLGDQVDFSFYASFALMWTAVEVNVGIICACVPTLKPLVTRILPKLIHDNTPGATEEDAETSIASPAPQLGDNKEISAGPEVPKAAELPPKNGEEAEDGPEMGFLDFLTMPGQEPAPVVRTKSHAAEATVYFGFVNMDKPPCMLDTNSRQSLKYCSIVTSLFFLWGFSYGLLSTLNGQISALSHSNSQLDSLGLQTAYFGAYLLGPLTVGRYVLIHAGFKATFITGLCIYGCGTLMFWPSAVLTSFPGFIISNLVVAFGLSVLETAANPFLALCGPRNYAEMRLLLAQGVQGVGSVLSPLLAQKVLFKNVNNGFQLIDVQWTYLAIALFDVILALFFYYMPLPEATDDELHRAAQGPPQLPRHNMMTISRHPTSHSIVFDKKVVTVTLTIGVASQLFYVAGQESYSFNFSALFASIPQTFAPLSIFDIDLIGRTTFALGRFLAAALCLIVLPRHLLLTFYALAFLFSILTTVLTAPNTLTAISTLHFFAEGPLFPLIFAITLRKLGRHTKSGAAYLTAAASGGGWFPWVMYGAQQADHRKGGNNIQKSFVVVAVLFAVGTLFPVYLSVVRGAREQVDPEDDEEDGNGNGNGRPGSGMSNRLIRRFGKRKVEPGVGDLRHGSLGSGNGVMIEHRERGSFGSL